MNTLVTWAVVLALIIIGGYFFLQQSESTPGDLGAYAYSCSNGSAFTMSPSADMTTVAITGDSQGMFTGTVTLTATGTNAHFEGMHGDLPIIFKGAGEEVQLSVGSESTVCNPVPSADMAPWNWGDPGEGGGSMQPDVRIVVGESLMGKWQSVDDAKFVREFNTFTEGTLSGTVIDWYEGANKTEGQYLVFTSENPAEVSFPLQSNKVYLQLTMQGTQSEKLNFSVDKLTPEELELTYMDRGGVLKFKAVQ